MLDLERKTQHRVAAILKDELVDHAQGPAYSARLDASRISPIWAMEQADGNGAKFLGSIRTAAGAKWKVYREYYSRLSARMVREQVKFPIPTSLNLLANGPTGTLRMNMEENPGAIMAAHAAQPAEAAPAPKAGNGQADAPAGGDAPTHD
ncbi:hypothetical protein ACOZ4Y_07065 [Komagataeibacter rhaeticus]